MKNEKVENLKSFLDVDDHVLQRLQRVADLLVLRQAADLQQPGAALEALLRSLLAGDVHAQAPRRRPWIHVRLDDRQKLFDDDSQGVASSLAMAVNEKRQNRIQIFAAIFSSIAKVFSFRFRDEATLIACCSPLPISVRLCMMDT